MSKRLSIVIPTFNRKDTLRVTLSKLAEQTYPPSDYEVIVVDDGSKDGTQDAVRPLIDSVPYLLRYLYHENRGPGATQNRGILEAHGDIVMILADDVWATPKLLETHMAFHARNPEPNVAVLGRVAQSPELPQTAFMKYWANSYQERLQARVKDGQELTYTYFWGCNLSLKRKFLLENGLFLEYTGAGHEDVELGYRLGQKGLRLLYSEAALGYHYHVDTLQTACRRQYIRGLNWWLLEDNVPDPELYIYYKVFSLKAGWPIVARLLPLHLIRSLFFNEVTVPHVFLPLLNKADTTRLAESIAHLFYARVLSYHFIKGVREGRKRSDANRQHNVVKHLTEAEGDVRIILEGKSNSSD